MPAKGSHLTPEHRAAIRASNLARWGKLNISERQAVLAKASIASAAATKGVPFSSEHKSRIASALTGRVFSVEHRQKLSVACKAHPERMLSMRTAEARAKSAASRTGQSFTKERRQNLIASFTTERRHAIARRNRHRTWTADMRSHMSATLRRRKPHAQTQETRRKISKAHRGKPKSVEQRAKISVARLVRPKEWRQRSAAHARRICGLTHPTRLERAVADILNVLGVEYQREWLIGAFTVDFYIPSKQLVIEADGAYWHGLPGAKERDHKRDRELIGLGYRVVRLPEALIKLGAANVLREAVA